MGLTIFLRQDLINNLQSDDASDTKPIIAPPLQAYQSEQSPHKSPTLNSELSFPASSHPRNSAYQTQ